MRLKTLGFHLVFCTRESDSFEHARAERIKISGNPMQYDDLQEFIDEQQKLRQLVNASILPAIELDVSDENIPKSVNKIAD